MNRLPDDEFKASMDAMLVSNQNLSIEAVKAMRKVMEQREQIIEAFIAAHGFCPDECVQVEFKTKDGGFGWCIRKRQEGEP